jgi:RHS repeat-associated protein
MKQFNIILQAICTVLSFLILPLFLKAQNKPTLTPSPNAASLGKYGDIPVSYFTGTATAAVPIGSVDEGSLSMPISLSYHTGGIKVGEQASWCGLGWSLQAGGMVTRVIQGVADDDVAKYGYYYYANQLAPMTDVNFLECGRGERDSEADIFSVNFNGNSAKFYFDKDQVCRFVERRDWIVTPLTDAFEFKGFVITIEDGTRYHFGRVQGTTTSPVIERSADSDSQTFSTTSWYLVKIESHDSKDAISLSYIAESYNYGQLNFCREFQVMSGCADGNSLITQCQNKPQTIVLQQGYRLTSITNNSNTQTINFIANTVRQDLPIKAYGDAIEAKRLDQIQFVSGAYTINHVLEYDYVMDGATLSRTTVTTNARLRLLRVKKQKGIVDDRIYSFEYLNTLGAGKETFYPTTFSKQIDHWGYYNGATGNDVLSLLAPSTKVFNDAATQSVTRGQANRESNETYMKHGSLRRVNYPTGGYTEFNMEANKHTSLETSISSNQVFFVNTGYGNSSCPAPLTTEKCFQLTDVASTYNYQIAFSATFGGGNCSTGAPYGTITFIDLTTNLPVATRYLPTTNNTGLLSDIFNFSTIPKYKVVINISNANLCVFQISKLVSTTQLVTRDVGGLRVQQLTNFDNVSQTSNSKTYTYLNAEGSTSSSGFLFSVPKYGHFMSNGYFSGVMFWSGSVVPMSNYQGYHIGYSRVEEKVVGDIGKTVYDYKIEANYLNPGNTYSSSQQPYPVAPRMVDFGNGQLNASTQFNNAGASVASTTNSGQTLDITNNGQLFFKTYFMGEVVPSFTQGSPQDCIHAPYGLALTGMKEMFKVTYYNVRTGSYRLTSKTSVLDNISTITTYKYDGTNRHLMSTGTKVTNSDNKEYETTIKYVHDYTGGELAANSPANNYLLTADLVTNLKLRNIISLPIESSSTVKTGTTTVTTSGQRMKMSFFDASGNPTTTVGTNPIYVYQSYTYETPHDNSIYTDANWKLKATTSKYNIAFGKPELYLSDGWNVSEKYTYHPTSRLVSKKEFLGLTTGLTWYYEYEANTKLLSKYTDENGLVKTFAYDPLMRLKTLKDRMKPDGTDPQATTIYDYHYKGQPSINATDLNSNFVGKITTFANVGNTTPLSSKQYLDGLGRPISAVREQYTPALLHQKNNVTYDALGRQDKSFLPFESSSLGFQVFITGTPFAFTTYEQSPLSRLLRQTNVDNTNVTLFYGANLATDNVRKFTFTPTIGASGTVLNNNVYYAANELVKTITWDENGSVLLPAGLPVALPATTVGRVETYKDKLGRTILTRKFFNGGFVDTYNFYDDYGSLVMVIPPGAIDANGNPTASLVFTYTYDSRNRLIEKKIPGADPQKFFYDNRELLTLMQDGNMRNPTYGGNTIKYLATQYNDIGQVLKTGWVFTSTPLTTALSISILDADKLTENQYYPNRTWVKHQAARVLKPMGVATEREFVWSYVERRAGYEYTGNPIWTGKQHIMSKTYVNGSTLVPNDAPITDNDYGGVDWQVSAYDGSQKPTLTNHYLYSGPSTNGRPQEVREFYRYTYDNAQRMTHIKYDYARLGNQPIEPTFILSNMNYNFKDQMVEKNTGFVNNKYLQSTDYAYNNRGWLTSINSGFLSSTNDYPLFTCTNYNAFNYYTGTTFQTPAAQTGEHNPDLFTEKIRYDDPVYYYPGAGISQRNGNISQIEWQVAGREAQGYSFKYDDLNRLTEANYTDIHTAAWASKGWTSQYEADNKFYEAATYDMRGNIQSMSRRGLNFNSMSSNSLMCGYFSSIDNLAYTYDPSDLNKLDKVTDGASTSLGFKTATNNSTYTYDSNGNLISDGNKNILNISYNHLNLPLVITFTNNNRIEFIYDATGAKLRKTVFTNNVVTEKRDYVNGVECKNNVLDRIATTEGAVVRQPDAVTFLHEYTIKDHLGNARVTYSDANSDGTIAVADIKQINHYYPFGMNMEGNWNGLSGSNKYQYNLKELNSDFGLNWNDYGGRFYDASIGRWNSVDPLSENYSLLSPYNYVTNNPVNAIDPDGRVVIFVNGYRPTDLISSIFREYYRDDYGTKTDWYGYWGETFISKVKNRLGDNNTVFYDGDAPFTTAKTKWGFNHRRQRGGQGARDFDRQVASGNIKLARDSNGKITESVKIFAHSMGYAYAQGMAEQLVSFGYKVEVIYAISPENPSAGQRPDGVDRLVQYGSPDDNVAPQGPIPGATGVDFTAKSGKWDATGGHGIGNYTYIFNIPESRSSVQGRKDEDKKTKAVSPRYF